MVRRGILASCSPRRPRFSRAPPLRGKARSVAGTMPFLNCMSPSPQATVMNSLLVEVGATLLCRYCCADIVARGLSTVASGCYLQKQRMKSGGAMGLCRRGAPGFAGSMEVVVSVPRRSMCVATISDASSIVPAAPRIGAPVVLHFCARNSNLQTTGND